MFFEVLGNHFNFIIKWDFASERQEAGGEAQDPGVRAGPVVGSVSAAWAPDGLESMSEAICRALSQRALTVEEGRAWIHLTWKQEKENYPGGRNPELQLIPGHGRAGGLLRERRGSVSRGWGCPCAASLAANEEWSPHSPGPKLETESC